MRNAVHFVGFRDDRFWNAVRVFGQPDFVHQGWDRRAQREIMEGDTIVFANGNSTQPVRQFNFDDSAHF